MFITVEGGEASGKSTQLRLLADVLDQRGIARTVTREPGGSPVAETLRGLMLDASLPLAPRTLALLAFAARLDHLATTIIPALDRGEVVISDRFADSTMVYQGFAEGVSMADLQLIEILTDQLPRQPDLTVIFDLDPATAAARLAGRGGAADRFEKRDAAFHKRVREGFRSIAEAEPQRCVIIDAAGSVEDVHARVLAAIARILPAAGDAAPAAR